MLMRIKKFSFQVKELLKISDVEMLMPSIFVVWEKHLLEFESERLCGTERVGSDGELVGSSNRHATFRSYEHHLLE